MLDMDVDKNFSVDKSNWKMVKFGDVVFEPKESVKDPIAEGIKHVVGLEHIDSEDIHLRRSESIEESTTFTKKFRKGDVLFGRRRAYLKKAAKADLEGICSGDIIVMRAITEALNTELLPFIVNNDVFFDYAVKHSAGGLSPRVKFKDLSNFEFFLPPKERQSELANLLWSLEDAICSDVNLLLKITVFLNSFVKSTTVQLINEFGTVRLEDVVTTDRPVTYGILKPGKGCESGIPVIKVRDYPEGEILQDNLLLTTLEIEEPYKRSRLQTNDLLFSIRGTIGRIAEVPQSLEGANITQDTARLSLKDKVNHSYIRIILESSFFQNQVKKRTTGLAVQGINLGELRLLKVPLPPESRQDEIADKVIRIKETIALIKTSIYAKKELQKTLIGKLF